MMAAQILREAATLPWVQGALAVAENKRRCHPRDGSAIAYCPEGAIYRVSIGIPPAIRIQAKRALYQAIGGDIIAWNDEPGRTPEEVKAKMMEAADALERKAD